MPLIVGPGSEQAEEADSAYDWGQEAVVRLFGTGTQTDPAIRQNSKKRRERQATVKDHNKRGDAKQIGDQCVGRTADYILDVFGHVSAPSCFVAYLFSHG
jgi:hypothetical protein